MSKTNLKPMPGYVVIKPTVAETKTASGIILPENENEKPLSGEVIAVGDNTCDCGQKCQCDSKCACNHKAPVAVGAHVVYKKWGGNEVTLGDEEYQILKFEDILAEIA